MLLVEGAAGVAPSPEPTPPAAASRLETLFERQVALAPDAPAVIHRGAVITYAALEARANRIGWRLRELGVVPETLVGLCMPRSIEMIAVMLAILKAGGAYLPLDPAYPVARLDYMLKDGGAALLIGNGPLPAGLGYAGPVLDLRADAGTIDPMPACAPPGRGTARSLAYVIYTSGSTGQPKGVMLEHSAVGMMRWAGGEFLDGEMAQVAATSSICFDPSVFEIFGPLGNGGTILLKDSPLDPFLPDERPTMLNTVPSVLAQLAGANLIPSSVKVINLGGERLSIDFVHTLYRTTGVERIFNHYGPTEASTCTTVALVPRDETRDPPVGHPICGALVHILDGEGNEAGVDCEGEIHISGPTLARGYRNAPGLTAERFIDHPRHPDVRIYRTGDIARRGANGAIEFIGRTGDLMKFNGHRIASGEIEAAILRLPGVRQAAVVIAVDEKGRDQLVAHIVGEDVRGLRLQDLRQALRTWLPRAMMPTWLQVHATMPLTLSGKLDRRALAGPVADPERAPDLLSAMEIAIADVFAAELGLMAVAPDDDFFNIGGDSLRAVAVAMQLELILDRQVSPALFGHAPTPRSLARALEEEHQGFGTHLTRLQGEGTAPPIFCLPDLYGRVLSFITLAAHFSPDQPLYGLSIGPLSEPFIRRPSFDTLLDAYVRTVREHQPCGPYRIAGYSFAGAFAQELARRLANRGEAVALVLIDAPNREWSLAARGTRALRAWRGARGRHGVVKAVKRALALRSVVLNAVVEGRGKRLPIWVPEADRPLAEAHVQALNQHRPRTFSGRTMIAMCRQQSIVNSLANQDGMLGWKKFLDGPIEHLVSDINHYEIVRNPFASELARAMERFYRGHD